MKKNSYFLTFVKFFLFAVTIYLLFMVYWSSLVTEEQLIDLKQEVQNLKQLIVTNGKQQVIAPISQVPSSSSFSDPTSPNLLTLDPFYEKTLPKMLPDNFQPSGVFLGATIGRPENLHPFSNWAQVGGWNAQCSLSLASNHFGIYETYAPEMALKIEERGNEFLVYLRDDVFWEPLQQRWFKEKLSPWFLKRHQVTADDFKFYFDALMNPSVQAPGAVAYRTYYDDIESIDVIDPMTFKVRWKERQKKIKYKAKQLTGGLTPLPSFVYKYFADGSKIIEDDKDPSSYRVNSVWAQNFTEHWAKNVIVSCGGWIFENFTDEKITFKRNPSFFSPLAVLMERQEVEFKNSPTTIWQDFKLGRLPTYTLQPDQLLELQDFLDSPIYQKQKENSQEILRLDYLARSYSYIGWNQNTPYFASKKVRQAMTMAIDRQRIIRQNLNGMGVEITGPFYVTSPSYDQSIKPFVYDPRRAVRLLAEEGWYDSDGDGVLDKEIDGVRVPFRFKLTYFVKNPTSKAIVEAIASFLKEIQIDCQLRGVDIADLSNVFDDKSFDAVFLAWALGTPPEDPDQLWSSKGATIKGSSNAVGFQNSQADKIIETLRYESDPEKRIKLYHEFHALIHQEQPYTFLFTPKEALLYREKVQNVFLPIDRQDLIPGANIAQPSSQIFWLK